jgi:DNA-binding SARP family transcriptional activator/TolB-like protein
VGTDVVAGVGTTVDSAGDDRGLRLRLLGPLTVVRDGVPVALPGSRKTRALLVYLAMAPRPVGRSHLCELLWDVPDDPRGELRWCLSKVRGILDEPGRRRVEASADMVRLDLGEGAVDALEVAAATGAGVEKLTAERLRELALLFAGDFLQGLEIDRSAQFGSWLTAHRRRFRTGHAAILEQLVQKLPAEEAAGHLEKWLELAPFDRRAHEILLGRLARAGQIEEGEAHLAATARLFESEGLDWGPVSDAWRMARVPRVSVATAPEPTLPVGETRPGPRRASIAVMPFVDRAAGSTVRGGLGDGLAHDVITRLAKLRSLFVIAQGTVLALDGGTGDAARTLSVDYVANGWFRRQGTRITVSVELSETRTARIVWAEVFDRTLDDALLVLEELGNRIVASLAHEIETAERNRAILKPPSSLDAWEAHHRGLWHMYRFDRAENERAQHFFKMAVELDPTFAQAYAGLSFTHFQNAFQGWANRDREIGRAFETAGLGLMVDDRDPAAHWAMGRALWLRGQQDHSVAELETSVDLSPNFALGHYALAFVHSQAGDPEAAIRAADLSRELSPLDPMLFGMLGSRAMALIRLGRMEEAAEWALRAAARPNAHAHILAITAHCLALAGRSREAEGMVAAIRMARPHYGIEDFLAAFRFTPDTVDLFRRSGRRIGLG